MHLCLEAERRLGLRFPKEVMRAIGIGLHMPTGGSRGGRGQGIEIEE